MRTSPFQGRSLDWLIWSSRTRISIERSTFIVTGFPSTRLTVMQSTVARYTIAAFSQWQLCARNELSQQKLAVDDDCNPLLDCSTGLCVPVEPECPLPRRLLRSHAPRLRGCYERLMLPACSRRQSFDHCSGVCAGVQPAARNALAVDFTAISDRFRSSSAPAAIALCSRSISGPPFCAENLEDLSFIRTS